MPTFCNSGTVTYLYMCFVHADVQTAELRGFKDNLVAEQENVAAAWALQQLKTEPGALHTQDCAWAGCSVVLDRDSRRAMMLLSVQGLKSSASRKSPVHD